MEKNPKDGREQKKLVLVGNPNVGKSVVFNYFTGIYVDVSNFPGTTVEISSGTYKDYLVMDTPGIYGVSSFNDEEKVARDVILEADVIVNVVDGVHLERDLFLTLQLADMGIPMVVAVNMMDEVERQKIEIDIKALEHRLGVPVIPIIAAQKVGMEELAEKLESAKPGKKDKKIGQLISQFKKDNLPDAKILLALEADIEIEGIADKREEIYFERRKQVDELCKQIIKYKSTKAGIGDKIGYLLLRPVVAVPVLVLVLFLAYQLLGVLVAGEVVDFLEGWMVDNYEPWINGIITSFIPEGSVLAELLVGEFGILTMTVTYVVALLLPLVITFHLLLAVLEDSGYLPRLATMLDRGFHKIGLNGRAVIPMVLGFGCVTMASISTRILGSDRERLIAIVLLSLTIPCSAQLGVIAGLLAQIGFWYFLLYISIIVAVFLITGTLLNKVVPGKSTDLLIDVPPMRLPVVKNVFQKTWSKSAHFVKEAGPIFALGALLIGVLNITGALEFLQNVMAPLVVSWMKLPKESATAFIMGIIRRDFGAAGFYDMVLTREQTLVAMTTLTLFVPCIASVVVILKERGLKQGLIVFLSCIAAAFLIGGALAQIVI
ncbi:MAG: ferrous iron transport protein B [Bacillota bacterium]|jgi:ferrous iron transport protein B|nr:ferrous iron transport protein B [Bacillota bacterium]HOA91121.1 ferrous iron transport protein B [Bacillota bacterium]HOP54087.1 ferrous iron transport protein B [Bacillota bacterium]HPQ09908.1 ferrous iron transport protein B [Bacillota bacterium]HPT60734.1 ferrous iron transport protein B [Bacillota bacterium]